jgi:hypothetical protein
MYSDSEQSLLALTSHLLRTTVDAERSADELLSRRADGAPVSRVGIANASRKVNALSDEVARLTFPSNDVKQSLLATIKALKDFIIDANVHGAKTSSTLKAREAARSSMADEIDEAAYEHDTNLGADLERTRYKYESRPRAMRASQELLDAVEEAREDLEIATAKLEMEDEGTPAYARRKRAVDMLTKAFAKASAKVAAVSQPQDNKHDYLTEVTRITRYYDLIRDQRVAKARLRYEAADVEYASLPPMKFGKRLERLRAARIKLAQVLKRHFHVSDDSVSSLSKTNLTQGKLDMVMKHCEKEAMTPVDISKIETASSFGTESSRRDAARAGARDSYQRYSAANSLQKILYYNKVIAPFLASVKAAYDDVDYWSMPFDEFSDMAANKLPPSGLEEFRTGAGDFVRHAEDSFRFADVYTALFRGQATPTEGERNGMLAALARLRKNINKFRSTEGGQRILWYNGVSFMIKDQDHPDGYAHPDRRSVSASELLFWVERTVEFLNDPEPDFEFMMRQDGHMMMGSEGQYNTDDIEALVANPFDVRPVIVLFPRPGAGEPGEHKLKWVKSYTMTPTFEGDCAYGVLTLQRSGLFSVPPAFCGEVKTRMADLALPITQLYNDAPFQWFVVNTVGRHFTWTIGSTNVPDKSIITPEWFEAHKDTVVGILQQQNHYSRLTSIEIEATKGWKYQYDADQVYAFLNASNGCGEVRVKLLNGSPQMRSHRDLIYCTGPATETLLACEGLEPFLKLTDKFLMAVLTDHARCTPKFVGLCVPKAFEACKLERDYWATREFFDPEPTWDSFKAHCVPLLNRTHVEMTRDELSHNLDHVIDFVEIKRPINPMKTFSRADVPIMARVIGSLHEGTEMRGSLVIDHDLSQAFESCDVPNSRELIEQLSVPHCNIREILSTIKGRRVVVIDDFEYDERSAKRCLHFNYKSCPLGRSFGLSDIGAAVPTDSIVLWRDADGTLSSVVAKFFCHCTAQLKLSKENVPVVYSGLDFETANKANGKVIPTLGCLVFEDLRTKFEGPDCLINLISYIDTEYRAKGIKILIISFNGGKFDMKILYQALGRYGQLGANEADKVTRAGGAKILTINWGPYCCFVDVMLLTGPGTLARMCGDFGLSGFGKADTDHPKVQAAFNRFHKALGDEATALVNFKAYLESQSFDYTLSNPKKERDENPSYYATISKLNGYSAYVAYCYNDAKMALGLYMAYKGALHTAAKCVADEQPFAKSRHVYHDGVRDEAAAQLLIAATDAVLDIDRYDTIAAATYHIHTRFQQLFPSQIVYNEFVAAAGTTKLLANGKTRTARKDQYRKRVLEVKPYRCTTYQEHLDIDKAEPGGESRIGNDEDKDGFYGLKVLLKNIVSGDAVSLYPFSALASSFPLGEPSYDYFISKELMTTLAACLGAMVPPEPDLNAPTKVPPPVKAIPLANPKPHPMSKEDIDALIAMVKHDPLRAALPAKHGVYWCLVLHHGPTVTIPKRTQGKPLNWYYADPFFCWCTKVHIDLHNFLGGLIIPMKGYTYPYVVHPGDDAEYFGEDNSMFPSLMFWRKMKQQQDVYRRDKDARYNPALRSIAKFMQNALLGKMKQRLTNEKVELSYGYNQNIERLRELYSTQVNCLPDEEDAIAEKILSSQPALKSVRCISTDHRTNAGSFEEGLKKGIEISIRTPEQEKFGKTRKGALKEEIIAVTMLAFSHLHMTLALQRHTFGARALYGIETDSNHFDRDLYERYMEIYWDKATGLDRETGEPFNPYFRASPLVKAQREGPRPGPCDPLDEPVVAALNSYSSELYHGCQKVGRFRCTSKFVSPHNKTEKICTGARWAKEHDLPAPAFTIEYGDFTIDEVPDDNSIICHLAPKMYLMANEEADVCIMKSKGLGSRSRDAAELVRVQLHPRYANMTDCERYCAQAAAFEAAPLLFGNKDGHFSHRAGQVAFFEKLGSGHAIDSTDFLFQGDLSVASSDCFVRSSLGAIAAEAVQGALMTTLNCPTGAAAVDHADLEERTGLTHVLRVKHTAPTRGFRLFAYNEDTSYEDAQWRCNDLIVMPNETTKWFIGPTPLDMTSFDDVMFRVNSIKASMKARASMIKNKDYIDYPRIEADVLASRGFTMPVKVISEPGFPDHKNCYLSRDTINHIYRHRKELTRLYCHENLDAT